MARAAGRAFPWVLLVARAPGIEGRGAFLGPPDNWRELRGPATARLVRRRALVDSGDPVTWLPGGSLASLACSPASGREERTTVRCGGWELGLGAVPERAVHASRLRKSDSGGLTVLSW
ncbi:hypothetical protein NDU88_006924 [Pleurodeles waltl]|uniref:Secreted protein n=1 Tax=Pleurodeles waltl TaxID=8319 RepID=A0AAV7VSY5_PLEWA|nr:hypothetical protein NDU88_006924 [Pleurodeles waltl]